jgi:hypothetical protein
MPRQIFNNARSTLAAPINTTDTSVILQPGHGPRFGTPSATNPVRFTIISLTSIEVMEATGRTADTLTGISRAVEICSPDTVATAYSFASGDSVMIRPTADLLNLIEDPLGWGMVCLVPPYLNIGGAIITPLANWTMCHRIMVPNPMIVSSIGVVITAQSGNISLGFARGPKGRNNPTVCIATTGSVACPANGYHEIPLLAPVYVRAGDWFIIGADNVIAACEHAGSAVGATINSQRGTACRTSNFVVATGAITAVDYARRAPILVGLP